MQPNPNAPNRPNLVNDSHSKFYDPSAPYRAMMMPPPPVNSEMLPNNQEGPLTNIDPKTGVIKRIPQFYYPRYNDTDDPSLTQPDFVRPRETNPYASPSFIEQPVPDGAYPYSQPDPYGAGHYYPYGTPYLMPPVDSGPNLQEQSKSDVIASHQKDADLSRLEIYHFTPKQNAFSSTGIYPTQSTQPIIQYHVYPNATGAPPQQQQPSQFPSNPHPWYNYPSNGPPYILDPSQPIVPFPETKARGSQTEEPSTKNRAVSPIYFSSAAPTFDDEGYPYVHQRTMHTDRYNVTTGRINRRFYDNSKSTAVADCRCLDCQRERTKTLNYYPD